ncbi:Flotillin-2 [Polyplax serrata]|uniref:Flotillin-2 n=1 Tax=Polyplax serrata TaxID=468196 RepID=A0AAN8S7V0_POLSC
MSCFFRENSKNDTQTGGCCRATRKITVVGGWAWAWYGITDVQRLSLEVMTLNPICEYVETAQGVPLTVTGVAQCKIMRAEELLQTASEQFLGKDVKEVKSTILQTLEGHLRAILGYSDDGHGQLQYTITRLTSDGSSFDL